MRILKAGAATLVIVATTAAAHAQTTRIVPVPQAPYQSVPGQNLAPPAPRQNLATPPMRTPRPGEGDSTSRIQSDWNSRMPPPPPPSRY